MSARQRLIEVTSSSFAQKICTKTDLVPANRAQQITTISPEQREKIYNVAQDYGACYSDMQDKGEALTTNATGTRYLKNDAVYNAQRINDLKNSLYLDAKGNTGGAYFSSVHFSDNPTSDERVKQQITDIALRGFVDGIESKGKYTFDAATLQI